ncbi:unnamed protein product [Lactuca saligna]|uniref:DUF659 domain-containing protein n=1 Tax=Lactuca saligna TaxID=75948 RepID=A0AA35V1W1_LACSI|nr:unnamed protein product [Lactuca saligna]
MNARSLVTSGKIKAKKLEKPATLPALSIFTHLSFSSHCCATSQSKIEGYDFISISRLHHLNQEKGLLRLAQSLKAWDLLASLSSPQHFSFSPPLPPPKLQLQHHRHRHQRPIPATASTYPTLTHPGFHHDEYLVSASNAVIADGSATFPGLVGNGTVFAGFPSADLKTAIETAGDVNQMSVEVDFVGTQFGVNSPAVPMPSNISLVNDGFVFPRPSMQDVSPLAGMDGLLGVSSYDADKNCTCLFVSSKATPYQSIPTMVGSMISIRIKNRKFYQNQYAFCNQLLTAPATPLFPSLESESHKIFMNQNGDSKDHHPNAPKFRPDVRLLMQESLNGVVVKKRKKQKLAEEITNFNYGETDSFGNQSALNAEAVMLPVAETIEHNPSLLVTQEEEGTVNHQVSLAIGRFLFDVGVPLDAVNSIYFQPMIYAIASQGSRFVGPSYHDLRSWILKNTVQEVRTEVDQCMGTWGKSGCSVLVDELTSENGKMFLNFSVYCPEGLMFLGSVDVINIIGSIDALYGLFKEIIEEVGVRNFLQIVTNNEERYIEVGKRITNNFPTIFWTPCATHCVDLMLDDFRELKWISTILEQGRSISRFINNHSFVLNMMRRYTFGLDIVVVGPTRASTDFSTLKRMVSVKHNLQSMVTSEEWMDCSCSKKEEGYTTLDYISNPSFWSMCTVITHLTDPLLRLLRIVSGKKRPGMGYVYAGVYRAKEAIKKELIDMKDLIVEIYVSLFIYLSGVEAWSFDQHLGVALFIPAGCPFQMRNLQLTVELGLDFFFPESLAEAVGKISLYAASSSIKEVQKLVLDPK